MKDVGNDKVTFKFYDTLKLDCLFYIDMNC